MDTAEAQALGQHDDDDLVTLIVRNLKKAREHMHEWRREAQTDYDYYASHQWDKADVEKMQSENRAAVTFNRVARTINAVTGLEAQNRQEVQFLPRETQDSGVGELYTNAAKWVRDNCDAEDEDSEAFQDAVICGIGCTETRVDYDEEPDGKIIVDRVDPMEMLVDCHAKKRNFDDAKWIARIKEVTRLEFEEMWPGHEDVEPSKFWLAIDNNSPHQADEAHLYKNDQADYRSPDDIFHVIQYQWRELETFYRVLSDSGKVVNLDVKKFNKLKEYIALKGLRYVKQQRYTYKQAFVSGRTLLEKTEAPINRFSFRFMTGLRDKNKNYWFGLVRLMRDPQMWANKWLSQILHIINTNAKGGVIVETDAVTNVSKFEENWAKPNGIVQVNPGGIQKILQKEAPRYPEGLDRLLQYAMSGINDITGVNTELLGLADRIQPGVLEAQRKQAGITILSAFFDSKRRYSKEQGRVLIQFIQKYISDGRLIRVVGQEGAKYVPLMKQEDVMEFDIIVDEAPSSPNMKDRVFSVLVALLPPLLQAGIPVPPDILDYAPIPDALAQKWKETLNNNPQKQQMQQLQDMLMQLEVQGKSLENQETESKTALNYAKANKEAATGEDELMQARQKAGMEQETHKQNLHMDMQKMVNEQVRKTIEMLLTQKRKDYETDMKMKQQERMASAKNKQEKV